ncbi:RDD family protein [Rhodobacteraceae bacterium ASV31]|nr:RDD family protein [Anianabacter salinae]MBV0911582.1 RDD family protein [Anianabacter salinae]
MTHTDPYSGLPDPDRHAEFYADVTIKRFFAWLIDATLILILTIIAVPFTAFTAIFYFPFLWLAIGLIYRIATLSGRSATPGMRLMAIEFRNRQGERFDLAHAALHTVIYTVALGTFLIQAASIILMLASARGQSLGDHLLGSAAINRAATR